MALTEEVTAMAAAFDVVMATTLMKMAVAVVVATMMTVATLAVAAEMMTVETRETTTATRMGTVMVTETAMQQQRQQQWRR